MRSTLLATSLGALALSALGAMAACTGSTSDQATADAAARAAALAALADSGARRSTSADTTGIPDLDFLRRMVDHHHGLIVLSRAVLARTDASAPVRDDARALVSVRAAEIDSMETILERALREHHTPTLLVKHQAMNDSVLAATGPALDRKFRESVIARDRESIAMMEEYAPRLLHSFLKRMVQRMRQDQTREIADLRQKLGAP
jgi:uncharacterized protein (DUF305 family)